MNQKVRKKLNEYKKRLEIRKEELRWLYMELYGNQEKFVELCENMAVFYNERPESLKDQDRKREETPDWYKQNDMLGMMFYIENFAGNIKGVEKKLSTWRRIT